MRLGRHRRVGPQRSPRQRERPGPGSHDRVVLPELPRLPPPGPAAVRPEVPEPRRARAGGGDGIRELAVAVARAVDRIGDERAGGRRAQPARLRARRVAGARSGRTRGTATGPRASLRDTRPPPQRHPQAGGRSRTRAPRAAARRRAGRPRRDRAAGTPRGRARRPERSATTSAAAASTRFRVSAMYAAGASSATTTPPRE